MEAGDMMLDRKPALLTRHGKQAALAPALADIGWRLSLVDSFDTDSLGTFTGETPRAGSQRDAALAKAKLACELSGLRHGIGSEGSFGGDPWLGSCAWATELLVYWDAAREYAVETWISGPETHYRHWMLHDLDSLPELLRQADFPAHGLIVGRPGEPAFHKSLPDERALRMHLEAHLAAGPLRLETDMRAHRNPTRMAMIARCAEKLAARLASLCPDCGMPGFGEIAPLAGAPCLDCGAPTRQPGVRRWQCPCCLAMRQETLSAPVSPQYCDICNP
ncbi:hypothetical protein C2134_13760 [Chromobacterium sinusclupearum]|uniref:DUF6671 domain-containing protein n=2 Tax=Chromobacterium sinusclupearum TaxID=2077146 RepID=A0A2K4MM34_9NEIS|nr:hypothetical protein C2134_13760 [Chromobacterium sinusclupearum]